MELLFANSIIGMIVPLIVAPFVINLLKQATNWKQINQDLKHENIERTRPEKEAIQKARDMQAINDLAIECAAATSETDIIKLIAEKLRDITNALGVGITIYDPAARTLTTRHIAVSSQMLSAANQLVGSNLTGMVTPVTAEMEKRMLNGLVENFSDLSEISFGAVPKPVALIVKNTLGVGSFTGMALTYGDRLIGSTIIAQREGQPVPDMDVCKTLAHVAAVSIQRKKTEDCLREGETKFRTLIESVAEGILLLDEQGHIIEWNPSQELLTGYKRKEVLGKFIWDIQFQLMPESFRHRSFNRNLKDEFSRILTSDESAHSNHRVQGKLIHLQNGDTKNILQTSFPIPTDTGYRIGSTMIDISKQKQVEAERERLILE